MSENSRKWEIKEDSFIKVRVDKFISDKTGFSRKKVKDDIISGNITVNNVVKSPDYKIRYGDIIIYRIPEPKEIVIEKENIPLDIMYIDDYLLVINKPPGLVVHPGAGNKNGTLVNSLLYHFNDWDINGNIRPGIVHRLDKETSGVMIIARNDESQQALVEMFKNREIRKNYLALVYGIPEKSGKVDSPIGRDPANRIKYTVNVQNSKSALTYWEVIDIFCNRISLLKVSPRTGRTHQIRVHLTSIGYPLLGDKLYKRKDVVDFTKRTGVNKILKRHGLHAWKISFKHPFLNKEMTFEAPLASDMKKVIDFLRNKNDCS